MRAARNRIDEFEYGAEFFHLLHVSFNLIGKMRIVRPAAEHNSFVAGDGGVDDCSVITRVSENPVETSLVTLAVGWLFQDGDETAGLLFFVRVECAPVEQSSFPRISRQAHADRYGEQTINNYSCCLYTLLVETACGRLWYMGGLAS